MARYSTFKYGGAKYGATPATTNLLWTFIVMWDGEFYDLNEGQRMTNLTVSRGRNYQIDAGGKGFDRYASGTATATFDNSDGRFNSWDAAGPLYPNVLPGKFVRIAVKNGSAGTNYELMRGIISDIQPYKDGPDRAVRIEVMDGLEWLRNKTVNIGLFQPDAPRVWSGKVEQAVSLILEEAGWPTEEWPYTYVSGSDVTQVLPQSWFSYRNALEAIRELEAVELGTFFHARDGTARFVSKQFTEDSNVDIDQSEILRDFAIPQPWEVVRNRIEVRCYPISLHDLDTNLWELTDTAVVPAEGGQRIFYGTFKFGDYQPVIANTFVDLEVNTQADGGGADITSSCSYVFGENEVLQPGDKFRIVVQNNTQAPLAHDGYITTLALFGDGLYAGYQTTQVAEDEDSQALYGLKTLVLKSPWMQETDYADDIAAYLLANLKDPDPTPVIQIEGRPTLQFPLDLYVDTIDLTIDEIGMASKFRIGHINHSWLRKNGQAVRTTLVLEPYWEPFS